MHMPDCTIHGTWTVQEALDLKIKKIIIIKKLKKKKPDADVGSAKHASQTHPKDVVFFIFYFFIFKVG